MNLKLPLRGKCESDSSSPKSIVTEETTKRLSFIKKSYHNQSYTILICDSNSRRIEDKQVTFNEDNIQDTKVYHSSYMNNNDYDQNFIINNNNNYRKNQTKSYESTEIHSFKDTTDESSTASSSVPKYLKKYQRSVNGGKTCGFDQMYNHYLDERVPTFITPDAVEIKNDYANKMTYCRPVTNLYNQQYIYKTMEKKKKLNDLVKKLVEARDKEKQKTAWNNYIRDLKLKHGVFNGITNPHPTPHSSNTVDILDDFYNTRFSSAQSNYCKNLLHDLYERGSFQTRNILCNLKKDVNLNNVNNSNYLHFLNETNPYYCYPSTSSGRVKPKAHCCLFPDSQNLSVSPPRTTGNTRPQTVYRPKFTPKIFPKVSKTYCKPGANYRGNNIIVPNEKQATKVTAKREFPPGTWKKQINKVNKLGTNKIQSTQTQGFNMATKSTETPENLKYKNNLENTVTTNTDEFVNGTRNDRSGVVSTGEPVEHLTNCNKCKVSLKEEYEKVSENVARLKQKNDTQKEMMDKNTLESIENKLDLLIIAINSLIVESKTAFSASENFSTCDHCISKKNMSDLYSDIPFSNINIYNDSSLTKKCDNLKSTNNRCNRTDCTSVRCTKRKQLPGKDNNIQERIQSQQNEVISENQEDEYLNSISNTKPSPSPSRKTTDSQLIRENSRNNDGTNNITDDNGLHENVNKLSPPELLQQEKTSSKLSLENENSKESSKKKKASCVCSSSKKKKASCFCSPKKPLVKSKSKYEDSSSDDSNNFGFRKGDKYVCAVARDNLQTPFINAYNDENSSQIEEILLEEMDKSDQAKRDIEDILNGEPSRPRAVQISFDIPTRECYTEVTESLSRTRLADDILEKFIPVTPQNMAATYTIAVNTDPLSLLALLRVSTDTIRQLLSYMQFGYFALLPSLPSMPSVIRREQFICDICGATFTKASHLSEHIKTHGMSSARDCCVCRHLLEVRNLRRPGLFSCQYCGQNFSRAYCCELHEQDCARRLGQRPDLSEDLALLR